MESKKIQLEVTVSEANIILESLGQQPYIKVAAIVKKIQQQGALQLGSNKENDGISKEDTYKRLVENEQ